MSTPHAAVPGAAPAAAPRWRIDRLTVLNWLAFLAILGVVLGEGCAMQAARRRQAREAREACNAAAAGVAFALGAPPVPASDADDAPAAGCPR